MRLRTNLEIYWDSLAIADDVPSAAIRTTRIPAARADFRYRGFSKTNFAKRDVPEWPDYNEIANIVPRWRDLVGYYTRFGDVRELVREVDDRYVIMNAGDELQLASHRSSLPVAGRCRERQLQLVARVHDHVAIVDLAQELPHVAEPRVVADQIAPARRTLAISLVDRNLRRSRGKVGLREPAIPQLRARRLQCGSSGSAVARAHRRPPPASPSRSRDWCAAAAGARARRPARTGQVDQDRLVLAGREAEVRRHDDPAARPILRLEREAAAAGRCCPWPIATLMLLSVG